MWDGFAKCLDSTQDTAPSVPPLQVISVMDPGQDLDDEMFMVLSAALTVRSQIKLIGVVTCLKPSGIRARLGENDAFESTR